MPEDHSQAKADSEPETEAFPAIQIAEPGRRRGRRPRIGALTQAALGAGLIMALGVGMVALAHGHARRSRVAPASAPPTEQALPDFVGPRSPVKGRITDRTAGISYDLLGGRWARGKDARRLGVALGTSERSVMKAGAAEYLAAPLQVGLGLEVSAEIAANVAEEVIRSGRYPARPTLTPYSPEQLPDGWAAGFQVGPSQGDWEVVVAAVFSTDLGRPSVFVVTVPKADRALLPDIRAMLRSVRPEIRPVGRANRM